jgi:hypothetical protein
MKSMAVVCGMAVGLMTGMAWGQANGGARKQHVQVGWIESVAHPVPGTACSVIQADIAAESGYVFVDDSTKKVVKAMAMSPALILPHAGEHVGIVGVDLPANGKTQFYIVQVVLDQKAVEQQAQQNAEAQTKANAEAEVAAKQKAADDALLKVPEYGPERTYQGWFIWASPSSPKIFIEESTNKKWNFEDENNLLYNNRGQHMVITAKVRTRAMHSSAHPGYDAYIALHLVNLVSIMKDQSPPPAVAAAAK